MRYLLLLFLSFPAYAGVTPVTWHVSMSGRVFEGDVSPVWEGSFTTIGSTITDWFFELGFPPFLPFELQSGTTYCFEETKCNTAAFVDRPCQVFSWHCDPTPTFVEPTYILFSFLSSPFSTTQLQLELDGPLSPQGVRAIGSVFGFYSNFIFHGAGTVSVVPEPTSAALGMTLSIMLIARLLGRRLYRG